MTAPPRSASVLLADAARLIETDGEWGDLALDVIEAAEQRRANVPLTPELETWLLLAARLAAGRFTVASALSLIETLPDDPDPFALDRPAETPCRRPGVQHLAYVVEDAP